jgi:hypothetical protein
VYVALTVNCCLSPTINEAAAGPSEICSHLWWGLATVMVEDEVRAPFVALSERRS